MSDLKPQPSTPEPAGENKKSIADEPGAFAGIDPLLEDVNADSWFLQSIKESPSAISIVSTDMQGNILFWNQGAENLLGYTAEEVVGKQKIGIVYTDNEATRQTVREVFNYILAEKKGITCEVEEKTKDGKILWVRLTLSPRFDHSGNLVGILGIGENTTERRLAEQALAERVRLAALGAEVGSALAGSESLPTIMQKCVESIIVNVEADYAQTWTLRSESQELELLASAKKDGLEDDPDLLVAEQPLLRKIIEEKKPLVMGSTQFGESVDDLDDALLEKAAGFAGFPLIVQGRLAGVVNLYAKTPLTHAAEYALRAAADEIALGVERIWTYSALRASEERIRSILDNALDGIITVYQNGMVESFNPAAEFIFGYRAKEVIGRPLNLIFPDVDPRRLEGYFENHIEKGQELIGSASEAPGKRKNGSGFPVELAVSKLTMPERRNRSRNQGSQRPNLYILMVRDVTSRKEAEQELILSAKKAEESNKLKSDFINTVSHEFRTPLNVIVGNTPLLKDAESLPPPEEIVEIVEDIESAGQVLLTLIDDLLDFSKLEASKMVLNYERVSVKNLVGDVLSNFKVLAEQKGLYLKADVEDESLEADPVRLKQILLNLLSNAIKFTDEGGIWVKAKHDGDRMRFEVKDTGCGISKPDLKYIFDVFRQVDSSPNRASEGTGLGLAITKSLVDTHGGNIFAESVLGKGASLIFNIPIQSAGPVQPFGRSSRNDQFTRA